MKLLRSLISIIVYYILPRPLARAFVGGLVYLGMLTKKQIIGPRNIRLSVPSGCDHDCVFCITDIQGEGAPKHRNVLNFDEICGIVDSALALLSLNIAIVSNGEPLLYSQIQLLVDYIYTKSRGRAEIKIVTNGTSLSKWEPAYIIERHIHLWLSLHAGEEDVWKKIHRPKAREEIKFKELKDYLSKLNSLSQKHLTLHNVISTLNKDHLASILDFAQKTKSVNLFFGRLYRFPELQLNALEEREVLGKLESLAQQMNEHGIKHNISSFKFVALTHEPEGTKEESEVPSQELLAGEFYKSHNCYISWLFSTIDDVGQISSCGSGRYFGSIRQANYQDNFLDHVGGFIKETTTMKARGSTVEGCNCKECPHIQMNAIANKFLPY